MTRKLSTVNATDMQHEVKLQINANTKDDNMTTMINDDNWLILTCLHAVEWMTTVLPLSFSMFQCLISQVYQQRLGKLSTAFCLIGACCHYQVAVLGTLLTFYSSKGKKITILD